MGASQNGEFNLNRSVFLDTIINSVKCNVLERKRHFKVVVLFFLNILTGERKWLFGLQMVIVVIVMVEVSEVGR